MKLHHLFAGSIVTTVAFTSIGCARLAIDESGILYDQYGNNAGIGSAEMIEPGTRIFVTPGKELVKFPSIPVTWQFGNPDLDTAEDTRALSVSMSGSSVIEDFVVTAFIPTEKRLDYFRTYPRPLDTFMDTIFRQAMQEEFAALTQHLSPTQYVRELRTETAQKMQVALSERFPYMVITAIAPAGKPTIPPSFQEALDRTNQAAQEAEAARQQAETAKAKAAAEFAETEGKIRQERARLALFSNPNYQKMVNNDNYQKWLEKWNGVLAPTIQGDNVQVPSSPIPAVPQPANTPAQPQTQP